MGLDKVIRSAVATVHKVVKSLEGYVNHEAWISESGSGEPNYADAVPRLALIERVQRKVVKSTGQEVMSTHRLTFLEPIVPNGAMGRREPIDERDRFTLPDGTTGPIVSVNGLIDAGTPIDFINVDGQTQAGVSRAYLYEVLLG